MELVKTDCTHRDQTLDMILKEFVCDDCGKVIKIRESKPDENQNSSNLHRE